MNTKRLLRENSTVRKKKKIIFFTIAFVFSFSYLFASFSSRAAELLDLKICQPIRSLFSFLSDVAGFRIFEFAVAFSPLIVAFVTANVIRNKNGLFDRAALPVILAASIFLYAINLDIPSKVNLEISHGAGDISEEDCVFAAERVVFELNFLCKSEELGEAPFYADDVRAAVKKYVDRNFSKIAYLPRIKQSLFSEALTESKILAYYSFFTFEIYVNVEQPEYMAAFTSAHEMLHTVGITREDEANLFAFLSLFESDNSYLKYSAALRAFEYIAPVLHSYSPEKYSDLFLLLPKKAVEDVKKSQIFTGVMSNGVLSKPSETVNDKLVSLRDERGSESYSNTATLLIRALSGKN